MLVTDITGDFADEKLCPAIILTPSSPLDQTDYQILVIPTQHRRPSRFAWLTNWRAQPIQLPTSAESPLFPVTVIHPASDKRRRNRNRLAVFLAIPLILLLIHLLLAMMQLSAYHVESGATGSVWDPVTRLFGLDGAAHDHHGLADEAHLAHLPEPSLN